MNERMWLQEVIDELSGQRVLIAGDLMLDEYVWGEVTRVSPEAPVPIVEVQRRTSVPGGAGNTAANVAALGGTAHLAGVVGRDAQADQLREALILAGVSVEGLVVDCCRPTVTKTRIVAQQHQMLRLDTEQRQLVDAAIQDAVLEQCRRILPQVDACILSDYAKGLATRRFAEELIALARQQGKPVIVDPKGTDYSKYRGAAVITPNLLEAHQALNLPMTSGANVAQLGSQLLQLLPGTTVLLTLGAAGMALCQARRDVQHIAAQARKVFDVTGAGDTVVAALALALAAGVPLELATRLANQAAGIVVGKFGTSLVTYDELIASLRPFEAADEVRPLSRMIELL
jgi:D-beta-D-heptose 7-phosphate kinase/D-beta-D-heptose 1-phosphate adenosyltransferase